MDAPLFINRRLSIPPHAIEFRAIRASGPGGQSVNKTHSAVQLRLDLNRFYLPESYRNRIAAFHDSRISRGGIIVIKAQTHRSPTRNKEDALARLQALLRQALHVNPPRRATRPSRNAVRRRQEAKTRRSALKSSRRSPPKSGRDYD